MNEFLIGKYVKFHDVLTYKQEPFTNPSTFNETSYKQGFYFTDSPTQQKTSLFIIKSDVIKFEKSQSLDYIYIFEDSDLPYFELNNNITVIDNYGSILNTRELNPEKIMFL